MPFKLGGWELVILLVVVLIIFGAGKLPQVGGAIGKGLGNLRKGMSGKDEADTGDRLLSKGKDETQEEKSVVKS